MNLTANIPNKFRHPSCPCRVVWIANVVNLIEDEQRSLHFRLTPMDADALRPQGLVGDNDSVLASAFDLMAGPNLNVARVVERVVPLVNKCRTRSEHHGTIDTVSLSQGLKNKGSEDGLTCSGRGCNSGDLSSCYPLDHAVQRAELPLARNDAGIGRLSWTQCEIAARTPCAEVLLNKRTALDVRSQVSNVE